MKRITFMNSRKKDQDALHLEIFAYVLALQMFVNFFSVVTKQFNLGDSSTVTIGMYALSLAYILFRVFHTIHWRDWGILLFIYSLVALNYCLFPETRSYLMDQSTLLVFVFFIPIAVFSTRKIRKWDNFFIVLDKYSLVTLLFALVIILFLDYKTYLVYMGFSYTLLPFVAASYNVFRTQHSTKSLVITLLGGVLMVVFGARAAILFLLMYVLLFEVTRSDKSILFKFLSIIVFGSALLVIASNLANIANHLLTVPMFKNSYFLRNIARDTLMESDSRDALYELCKERISTMGKEITGLFGDRIYCAGEAYPHNFVYEILMSFGWGFGIITLLSLAVLVVKTLFGIGRKKRDIAIYLLLTVFARYSISGSYLIEGKFWVVLFAMFALCKQLKKRADEGNTAQASVPSSDQLVA